MNNLNICTVTMALELLPVGTREILAHNLLTCSLLSLNMASYSIAR